MFPKDRITRTKINPNTAMLLNIYTMFLTNHEKDLKILINDKNLVHMNKIRNTATSLTIVGSTDI